MCVSLHASHCLMKLWHRTAAFVELGKWECPRVNTEEGSVCEHGDEGWAVNSQEVAWRTWCHTWPQRESHPPQHASDYLWWKTNGALLRKIDTTKKIRYGVTFILNFFSLPLTCSHHTLPPRHTQSYYSGQNENTHASWSQFFCLFWKPALLSDCYWRSNCGKLTLCVNKI